MWYKTIQQCIKHQIPTKIHIIQLSYEGDVASTSPAPANANNAHSIESNEKRDTKNKKSRYN